MNRIAPACLIVVCLSPLTLAAEPTAWRFDFEQGLPDQVKLMGASVTNDPQAVVAGKRSVLADYSDDDGSWHEFLHTMPEVRFEKGKTYAVRFQYRIVSNTDQRIEFYSQLRSFAGKGDIQGDNWLWRQPQGHASHVNRLFTVEEDGNYYFMIGVRYNGSIAIDDLEIRETAPNRTAIDLPVRTHPTPIAERRQHFDRLHRPINQLVNTFLVITLDEGAGGKIHKAAGETQGGAKRSRDEIVRDLQPDFIDWNLIGPLAKEYGIRSSSGGTEYQEYYKFEPHDAPQAERDRVWDNRYEIFGDDGFVRTLENTVIANDAWGAGGYFTCHNAMNWHRHFTETMNRAAGKYLAITQDNIACSSFNRISGCYCPPCQAGFRGFLTERYNPRELASAGVKDVGSFSIQDYIVDHGLIGRSAVEDAIVREYMKYEYITALMAWSDCVAQAKTIALRQRRQLPCGGNQINAWGSWPFAVAISQFCDFIEIEELVGVKDKIDRRTLQYKLGLASGHHAKPVWVRGPVTDKNVEKGPMLSTSYWAIHTAEALANGGIPRVSLGLNTTYTGEAGVPDYLDDDELYKLYIDCAAWMREHRAILTDRESLARVALVYSFPSLMLRKVDALRTPDDWRLGKFEKTAKLLDTNRIPYDCVVFGHPEIWDDEPTFKRIREQYDVLILAGVDALTDDQAKLLQALAAEGVTLLADEPFERDENLNLRDKPIDVSQVVEATEENVIRLGQRASIVEATVPEHVTVNAWRSCRGGSIDVHLVNFDGDVRAETITPVRDARVRVQLPERLRLERCVLSRLGKVDTELRYERDGKWAEVTVPTFDAYAVVSFTGKRSHDIANKAIEKRLETDRKLVKRLASQYDLY